MENVTIILMLFVKNKTDFEEMNNFKEHLIFFTIFSDGHKCDNSCIFRSVKFQQTF